MAKFDINNLAEALYEATEGKSHEEQQKLIRAALVMLKKNGVVSRADELLEHFEKIHDKNHNTVRAEISSKTKLTEKEHHEIQTFIKHKHKAEHVIMEETEDKELLGGVKIKVGDTLYDGSLKSKLKKLEDYLVK